MWGECSICHWKIVKYAWLNKNKYYCKNWDKGLNNTYIINDKAIYPYSIDIPKENCLVDILSPILDFSKILNVNCKIRRNKKQILLMK